MDRDKEDYVIYNALLVAKQYIEEKGYKDYLAKYNEVMKDIKLTELEKK